MSRWPNMVRFVIALACVSCNGNQPPSAPNTPAPAVRDPAARRAAADPAKWACKVDADCMNSCSQGAVNGTWYRATKPSECDDGCANQLAETPRCIDGGCVAFNSDPRDSSKVTRNERCTRKHD